jgi:hypothetical protein
VICLARTGPVGTARLRALGVGEVVHLVDGDRLGFGLQSGRKVLVKIVQPCALAGGRTDSGPRFGDAGVVLFLGEKVRNGPGSLGRLLVARNAFVAVLPLPRCRPIPAPFVARGMLHLVPSAAALHPAIRV